jgi:hypothetical protein
VNKSCTWQGEPRIDVLGGNSFQVAPACYRDNPPELVWAKFKDLCANGKGTLDSFFYPD